MEIRRTSRPYLWYTPVLMLLGLWLGTVLAKGASNQSATAANSQAWQRYHSQGLNASPAPPDELEILDAPRHA
ncbi:GM14668 [Drosophila sechellia]|uniref:GM14668 n=1 Tax=Drosophila sechellia TaxID=7238 RepID=B4HU81_DROSE|nr:GM14668 [Drosophila sechellia]